MPPLWSELTLTGMLLGLAALCLLTRRLSAACLAFILFALSMTLAWWWLGARGLAVAELLLGALGTGAALWQAQRPLPMLDRREPGASPKWLSGVTLLVALPILGLPLMVGAPTAPLAFAGAALILLGLWAFVLYRHLLRRLLAFNLLGSGVFLVLATRVGPTPEAQGLILVGLCVALLGSLLGALLIRRLHRQGACLVLSAEGEDE